MQPNQGFPGGSLVKNLPANARDVIDVGSVVGWEDPLEEGMAARSSVLAWRIPWTEEPGGLQSVGSQSQTRLKRLSMHILPQLSLNSSHLAVLYLVSDSSEI